MHDDRSLVEARLRRVLDERVRPALYPESIPLEVAVWHAPGEPVPVAEGLAAEPEPIEVGAGSAGPGTRSSESARQQSVTSWRSRSTRMAGDMRSRLAANAPGEISAKASAPAAFAFATVAAALSV
jgi:alpha-mannosidase